MSNSTGPTPSGAFVWYDLMTPDPQAATAFYRDVIGWTAEVSTTSGKPYTLLSANDIMVAGLMETPEEVRAMGIPPCWSGYIGVADLEAKLAALLAAGGSVRRPVEDIPSVGRFAVVADPQGAVFILFSPFDTPPRPAIAHGTPGHIGWHELYAGNGPEAFAFYSALFGWTKAEAIDMGEMGVYQLFAAGGPPVGGIMTKPPQVRMPHWNFVFNVAEINAAVARVQAGGGQVMHGPMQVPGGQWVAHCQDPQGAMFSIVA